MINENFAQGAAYVFSLTDGTWTQTQKLTADDGQMFDQFGYSVGLSGTTAVISADAAQVGSNAFQGAAYVFDGSSGTWTNTQKLSASDGGIGDIFGIALSFDGTNAVIGAYANAGYQGAAYVFQATGGYLGRDPEAGCLRRRHQYLLRWFDRAVEPDPPDRLLGCESRRQRHAGRGIYLHRIGRHLDADPDAPLRRRRTE